MSTRKVKATPTAKTLDNGMGDELLARDFREMRDRCLRDGLKPETAGLRAAQLVVFKLALKMSHTPCQQGEATECAKCSAYGIAHQLADGWHFSRDAMLADRCGS